MPAAARDFRCFPRLFLRRHLGDGQVRRVRPLLRTNERFLVQSVVQLLQARGAMRDPNKYGGRYRDKRLHLAERHLKSLDAAARFREALYGRAFCVGERSRRQNGHMRCELGQLGMEFPTELFEKISNWIPNVGDQGVTGRLHLRSRIIPCLPGLCRLAWAISRRSTQLYVKNARNLCRRRKSPTQISRSISILYFLAGANQSAKAFAFGVPKPVISSQPTFAFR
jgi:hypothetical protein